MRPTCSRCGTDLTACVVASTPEITKGYYDVSQGYWKQFAAPGEVLLCDDCMHADPKYREHLQPRRGTPAAYHTD